MRNRIILAAIAVVVGVTAVAAIASAWSCPGKLRARAQPMRQPRFHPTTSQSSRATSCRSSTGLIRSDIHRVVRALVRPSVGESVAARLGHHLSIELMDAAENGCPRSLRWPRCEHLKHHLARRGRGLMQEQIDLALTRPLGPRGCHDDPWIGNPREDEVIDAIP